MFKSSCFQRTTNSSSLFAHRGGGFSLMDLRLAGFSAEALEGGCLSRILPMEVHCSFWSTCVFFLEGGFWFWEASPKKWEYSWYFVGNVSRLVILLMGRSAHKVGRCVFFLLDSKPWWRGDYRVSKSKRHPATSFVCKINDFFYRCYWWAKEILFPGQRKWALEDSVVITKPSIEFPDQTAKLKKPLI